MKRTFQSFILVALLTGLAGSAQAYPGMESFFPGMQNSRSAEQHMGFLGVLLSEVSEELAVEQKLNKPGGVLIAEVMDGLAGDQAGLQAGDVVVKWDDQRVVGVLQFKRLVSETPPGRTVNLRIVRESESITIDCTVGSRAEAQGSESPPPDEEPPAWPWRNERPQLDRDGERPPRPSPFDTGGLFSQGRRMLGVIVLPLEPQLAEFFGVEAEGGMLVSSVRPDSAAAAAGLQAGDVLLQIDDHVVFSASDVSRMINRSEGSTFDLHVIRNQKILHVQVNLGDEQEAPAAPLKDVPEIGEGAEDVH